MQKNTDKAMTANEIIQLKNQHHLSSKQKEQMEEYLKELEDLFQGKVGNYKGNNIKFELKPGVQPFYSPHPCITASVDKGYNSRNYSARGVERRLRGH